MLTKAEAESRQLATAVLTETMHGPTPLETVEVLARAVLVMGDELDRLRIAAASTHGFGE